MAQETLTSLGPFFVFLIIWCWIHRLCLPYLSHPHCPPPCALLLFLSCRVIVHPCPCPCHRPVMVVLIIMWWLSSSSCCGCPPCRLPPCRSLTPLLLVSVSSCDVVFVIVAHFLFVIVPSLSSLCQLLIPPHQQVLVVVAWVWVCHLGTISW